MTAVFHFLARLNAVLTMALQVLEPVFLLVLRAYVAWVFFRSGLTKIDDFSATIELFESEYRVPLLSPTLAAYSGTAAELVLPVLFVLGIAARPTALALFIFNVVAVLSYPGISDAGVKDHLAWGTMIAVVAVFGAGRLSLDRWLAPLLERRLALR